MSDDPKLTGKQLERIILDARAQEKIDEAEAMSEEELDRLMKEEGVTENDLQQSLARQRLRFEAEVARRKAAAKKAAPPESQSIWTRIFQVMAVVGGLSAPVAAAEGVVLFMKVQQLAENVPHLPTIAAAGADGGENRDHDTAVFERNQALRSYAVDDYRGCLEWLDDARKLDPTGEADDTVLQHIRQRSEQAVKKAP